MKYQNLKSFEKHLASAAPHNLCRLYLVAMADDFERTKVLNSILVHFSEHPIRFIGSDCNLKEVIDAMDSFSLLGESIVVIDEVDKIAKKEQQLLCEHLNSGVVLLGARGKCAAVIEAVEKEGVVLDLLEEKPWDKEKRLAEQLIARAKLSGKQLDRDAPQLLFDRLGFDPALLESEIDKLICYAGKREQITTDDILKLTPASRASTLWQTAEEVIWEGGFFASVDSAAFHALIPSLRSQLHLGLVLATLIEEKRPSDTWSGYLPKIWPKMLEKRSSGAARLGSAYFRKGLDKLFDLELASRNNSTQYRALLDLFRAQLHAR